MRKIYLIACASLLTLGARAQIIWSEDFESGTFPPAGWTIFDNGIGIDEAWEETAITNNGAGAAYVQYENAGDVAEDWLVTGQIDLTSTNSELRFFTRQEYEDEYFTTYEVRISTASQTNPNDFVTVASWDESGLNAVYDEYEEKIVNLAAYDGDLVYIAFVMIQENGDDWYIDDISIGDGPACPAPSLVQFIDLDDNSVTVSWTAGNTETDWNVEYGEAGFTPGSGTTDVASATPEYAISGLDPETEYEFYVQADCGGDQSDWVGPISFTTTCVAPVITALPWTDDFESVTAPEIPCGWTVEDVNDDGIEWMTDEYAPQSGLNSLIVFYNADEDMNDWIHSPEFVLTAGTSYRLSFGVRVDTEDYPENLAVYIGDDNTSAAMTTQLIDLPQLINSTYETQFVDFTVPANGSYHIGFHGYSEADMSAIFVDDVTLDLSPDCPEPSAVTADMIDSDEAQISWTAAAGQTDWNIEYGETGFTPGSGTTDVASATPEYTVTGLDPEMTYDFYVQADCGGGEESTWAGPFTFTTSCVAPVISALPWTEDFDAVTTPDLPCGWMAEDVNSDDFTWTTADYIPQSGLNSLYISYNDVDFTEEMNDWVYTPELVLDAGTNYRLTFVAQVGSEDYPENLAVAIGDAQASASMTTQLIDLPNMTNEAYEQHFIDFAVPASGSYYIGFHGYSEADMLEMYIDDVTLDLSPDCPEPNTVAADMIGSDEAQVSWTTAPGQTDWNIEYGPAGFTPGTGTPDDVSVTPEYTMSGLDPETTYDFYVQADCGGGEESVWTGPFTFTTSCVAPVIASFPWTEDFDAVTMPELPCGWLAEDVNGDNETWMTSDEDGANTAPNALEILWNANEAMNDWVYTPELVLEAGTTYTLQFNYASSGETFPENLEVFIGTTQSNGDMTTELVDLPNITNDTFVLESVDFTVPANGSYYIGFHGYSEADMFYLLVDDVTILDCQPESASLALSADTLCVNDPAETPVVTGTAGGSFYGTTGLEVDPATGEIDPAASTPGDHILYYVTSETDCADTAQIEIVVDNCGVGIDEFALAGVALYPNPTNGAITAVIPAEGTVWVSVTDFAGKEVIAAAAFTGQAQLDLSALQNGVYFVRFSLNNAEETRRVVLTK